MPNSPLMGKLEMSKLRPFGIGPVHFRPHPESWQCEHMGHAEHSDSFGELAG